MLREKWLPLRNEGPFRFLVVDDDDVICRLVSFYLTGAGADPVQAMSGTEALDIARSSEPFDLVITDLTMPDVGGYDLLLRLMENGKSPRAAIVMSAYPLAHVNEIAASLPHPTFTLQKPFLPLTLREVVMAALETGGDASR
jgi:CheY-like chemotaxis protein